MSDDWLYELDTEEREQYEYELFASGVCDLSCPIFCDGSGHLDPFDTNEEARGER